MLQIICTFVALLIVLIRFWLQNDQIDTFLWNIRVIIQEMLVMAEKNLIYCCS